VGTLGERLGWILQHRGFRSRRALARAAGLSASHVALATKGDRGLSPSAAQAVAAAAGVDLAWLVAGEGAPDKASDARAAPSPSPDPCPRREQALALLEGSILPSVAAALRLERPAHDLSLEEWLVRAKELQRLLKAFREDR
jgi:transcriptional regulator with XRE-family HTH domain